MSATRPRILYIGSSFFDYQKLISAALERKGFDVVYLPDRPPVGSLMKIAIRKFRWLVEPVLNSYYLRELARHEPFDRVLIIKGEAITPKVMERIRSLSRGPITLYQWDGLKNVPGGEKLVPLVDRVLTFDPEDAQKFGFELLPLFYVKKAQPAVRPVKWPIAFMGSVHGDRLAVIARVRKATESFASMYVFVYFPSILIYWFRFLFDLDFHRFKKGELSLKSRPKAEIEEVFESSVAVLDVHHRKQTGLTMRTIETLALGKKLITTNTTIKQYEFYHPDLIHVIDRRRPVVPKSFLTTPTPECSTMLGHLEIDNWIGRLIE